MELVGVRAQVDLTARATTVVCNVGRLSPERVSVSF